MTPDAPQSGGWQKSTMSPHDLAAKIDKRFATLTQAGYDSVISISQPDGGKGMVKAQGKILSPRKFNVIYEEWQGKHPARITLISNGKTAWTDRNRSMAIGSKKPTTGLLKTSPIASRSQLPDAWLKLMPSYVLGWYLHQTPVYVPLVDALMNPASHFKVITEKRTTTYQGRIITDYRLLATRSADKSGGKGYGELEIVVDGGMFLPVTVRARYREPKGGADDVMWSGRWYPLTVTSADVKLP